MVGAAGTAIGAKGTTGLDTAEGAPCPLAFAARTTNVYVTP